MATTKETRRELRTMRQASNGRIQGLSKMYSKKQDKNEKKVGLQAPQEIRQGQTD